MSVGRRGDEPNPTVSAMTGGGSDRWYTWRYERATSESACKLIGLLNTFSHILPVTLYKDGKYSGFSNLVNLRSSNILCLVNDEKCLILLRRFNVAD